MNVIFMGTPDFAVPCLNRLIEEHNVLAVFTQPDKPVGRKQLLTPPPVKELALSKDIPVFQPHTLKNNAQIIAQIKAYNADIIVVVAYGKILPLDILTSAKHGCINVHASLLPKYRGAAPIQWAVINGDSKTGVSIMQMNEGLDTGDVILAEETDISVNETSEELFDRLSVIGAQALSTALEKIENGTATRTPQNDTGMSYAQKITKELSPVDWSKSALEIHNLVRGLNSWPSAETLINGRAVKIHKTLLSEKTGNKAGEIVDNKNVITVSCGDGKCVDITELQPQGKKRMDSKSFLLGNKLDIGTVLGE